MNPSFDIHLTALNDGIRLAVLPFLFFFSNVSVEQARAAAKRRHI